MDIKKDIKETLNAYKSEVDNFNDAIFEDKINALTDDLNDLFVMHKVNRSLPIDTRQIFRWLLGYEDFPQRVSGEGRYYWRKYLRRKLSEIGIEIK